MQPSSTDFKKISPQQIERLANDPSNKVYEEAHDEVRAAWSMAEAEPLFRRMHTEFVQHARRNPGATLDEDEKAAVAIVRAGGERMIALAEQHPGTAAKLTTRTSALSPLQMNMLWQLIAAQAEIENGADPTAIQKEVVASTLTQFARASADSEKMSAEAMK